MTDVTTQAELDAVSAATKSVVPLSIPIEMKAKLEELADEAKQPVSTYVRKLVADAIGYELPADLSSRKKYNSADERKAAAKDTNKSRADLVKKLLALVKAGKISPEDLA